MTNAADADISKPLSAAVAAFHARTPPRIWSLIVSFLGDAVLPRGGAVQAGVISEFCGLAGIEPGLVRTALSRLVNKGIVARDRDGRRSFYRLTPDETLAFNRAADLIYGRRLPIPTGNWELVLTDRTSDRQAARDAALSDGFAAFGPNVFIRPQHRDRSTSCPPGGVCITTDGCGLDGAHIAALWPVKGLADSYLRFVARYRAFASAGAPSPADALLARVLMVHDYRRILFRDPFLQEAALGGEWPADNARGLFAQVHAALSPPAEHWLDAHLE